MAIVDAYKAVLDELRTLPETRERRMAIERIEESAYWASCAMNGIVSGIEYVSETKPLGEVLRKRLRS